MTAPPAAEHDALVAEARARGGWAGCLQAAWAGRLAAGLGRGPDANPFGAAPDAGDAETEAMLAAWWHRGRADALATVIPPRPAALVAPGNPLAGWKPRPGRTHAAATAPAD